jgi:hypothetical protein
MVTTFDSDCALGRKGWLIDMYSQTLISAVDSCEAGVCTGFCFGRLEGKVVHHWRCIHGDGDGVDACE